MIKELKTKEFAEAINVPLALVKFYTQTCIPCKMVAPTYEKVSEQYPTIPFYSIDAEAEYELAPQNNIMSVPVMIAFVNGKEVARVGGMVQENHIIALIEGSEI